MMEKPELIYSRYPVTAVAMAAAALMLTMLSFSGCRHVVSKSSNPAVVNMITAASEAKDYARILSLADSLEKASQISPCESHYWQGYAYYRMGKRELAKSCWQEAIRVAENSADANDLVYYAKSASYLTSQLCRYAEYAAALYTALPVINRLEKTFQEQFGDERLLDFLRNFRYDSARQVIETIAADVERHRDGAEPNDDLTMMCLCIKST